MPGVQWGEKNCLWSQDSIVLIKNVLLSMEAPRVTHNHQHNGFSEKHRLAGVFILVLFKFVILSCTSLEIISSELQEIIIE